VKRAESAVHRDTREKVEAEALGKAKQAETERRKQGKGAWFMKRCAFLHLALLPGTTLNTHTHVPDDYVQLRGKIC